ncbi:hypothetical protein GcC1_016015 [Golovinomyces cichoracearum]|uniref:Uncharacterized protein n=1 Tax=Golovinomyces cichoracearum TaxID=62708 RepID=A0A420J698_9PEZI|nr:hypothetical protein GcC1_016015 [Golovinomyces cichoracearum]
MAEIKRSTRKEEIPSGCGIFGRDSSTVSRPPPRKGIVKKTKRYAIFLMNHVKKGEVPWTQWYCCHVVNGFECEKENHRIHKNCKNCKHRVCENCIKGTL